ncbi:uncharacterized protein LOC143020430 [Oratosquilla oratoria]|uniref:uncharacterized protein LOC143020430 n=1 Tax=Oratosquilla oratoria TaxID=337810 RepID=UPI003F75A122
MAFPDIQHELIAEASRKRGSYTSDVLERRHRDAAKSLRDREGITVRRADKAAMFVLIPTDEYLSKLDGILADETKFQRLTRDPTLTTVRKANKIIDAVNAHKIGKPLRPIISQIPTPTYQLAKRLNALLTPLVPADYCYRSSTEFLDCVNSAPAKGEMASLDAESLFTCVSVPRTIDYICDHEYRSSAHPLLAIDEYHLRDLLRICTQESAFRCPRGNLYQQKDGVFMGSPLGVLLANFFMGSVEKEAFSRIQQPMTYGRYIDDIFVRTRTSEEREELRQLLQEISGLRFKTQEAENGTLPFLDVLLTQEGDHMKIEVYVKPTNPGLCLSGESECPQQYKDSTIASLYRRALTHCSSWTSTQKDDPSGQLARTLKEKIKTLSLASSSLYGRVDTQQFCLLAETFCPQAVNVAYPNSTVAQGIGDCIGQSYSYSYSFGHSTAFV